MKTVLTLLSWILQIMNVGALSSSRTHFSSKLTYYVTDLGYLAGPSKEEVAKAFKAQYSRDPKYVVEISPHDLGPTPSQGQPLTVFELARRLEDLGVISSPDRAYFLRYPKEFYDPASVL